MLSVIFITRTKLFFFGVTVDKSLLNSQSTAISNFVIRVPLGPSGIVPTWPHARAFLSRLLQRVLIDSPTHEFPLGNSGDLLQLLIRRNRVAFALVLDRFEF